MLEETQKPINFKAGNNNKTDLHVFNNSLNKQLKFINLHNIIPNATQEAEINHINYTMKNPKITLNVSNENYITNLYIKNNITVRTTLNERDEQRFLNEGNNSINALNTTLKELINKNYLNNEQKRELIYKQTTVSGNEYHSLLNRFRRKNNSIDGIENNAFVRKSLFNIKQESHRKNENPFNEKEQKENVNTVSKPTVDDVTRIKIFHDFSKTFINVNRTRQDKGITADKKYVNKDLGTKNDFIDLTNDRFELFGITPPVIPNMRQQTSTSSFLKGEFNRYI